MPSFFITGTDTGVGKTWFTCWLVRSWRVAGHSAMGLKPISTGDRSDAENLREAGGNKVGLDAINPIYLREPAAPLIAASMENRRVDIRSLNRHIAEAKLRCTHLAVEGVGGWRVPLAQGYDVRDWARDLGMPVVIVARAGLGTLNHTLLTVESIRDAGLTCAGIILNAGVEAPSPNFDFVRRTNFDFLRERLGLPILELDRGVQAAGKAPVWLGGE